MSNIRIMVVEDEWVIAEDIQKSLKDLGYTVSSAVATGEEAIRRAEEDKPDLVLMDIVLKGEMDGIGAASQIHSRFKIPIIYLTAYDNKDILERAKITGPFGYMIKPFEERELHTTIEMALYKHKLEGERERLVQQLQVALSNVKLLSGLIPICSSCKKVRNSKGNWENVELFIRNHSEADFSHGICPGCCKKLYPDLFEDKK